MAQRKPFLLRLDPATHLALERWASAELRSLNAQIEFLLRDALRRAGRLPEPEAPSGDMNTTLEAS
ncbi:MAG TPA: hypothetical protein VLH09_08065 [Bryobacteraceae bacterium]|nr:hypothetical protein [Bryobacteraceae bacterium]